MKSIPDNYSKNFGGRTITMEFDEDIEENSLRKNLIITPNTDLAYKAKIKRNVFTLTFEKGLEPNTTYSLYFRESLRDIAEKNYDKELKLIFSTGTELDSASIRGKVYDIITGMPTSKALVALYPQEDTIDIRKHAPIYFTYTDDAGSYALQNLPSQQFIINSFIDKNDDLKWGSGDKVAMSQQTNTDQKEIKKVNFGLFNSNDQYPQIISTSVRKEYTRLVLSKPVHKFKILNLDTESLTWFYDKSDSKVIHIYNFSARDSAQLTIELSDSLLRKVDSTLYVPLAPILKTGSSDSLSVKLVKKEYRGLDSVLLTFDIGNNLIQKIDTSKIIFNNAKKSLVNANFNKYYFYINILSPSKDTVSVSFKKGAITDIYGQVLEHDTLFRFTSPEEKGLGTIKGTIDRNEFIKPLIELINSKGMIVWREFPETNNYTIPHIAPDKYRIRVVEDLDNSGYWTTGSMKESKNPEQVTYYPEAIELKANWTIEKIDLRSNTYSQK